MAEASEIVARVRRLGANLEHDAKGLRIINRAKLPPEAISFIEKHKVAIADYLDEEQMAFEERAAIIEFDGHTPREWAEQFARLLIKTPSPKIDRFAMPWFRDRCGEIIDAAPLVEDVA